METIAGASDAGAERARSASGIPGFGLVREELRKESVGGEMHGPQDQRAVRGDAAANDRLRSPGMGSRAVVVLEEEFRQALSRRRRDDPGVLDPARSLTALSARRRPADDDS